MLRSRYGEIGCCQMTEVIALAHAEDQLFGLPLLLKLAEGLSIDEQRSATTLMAL